jgi:molybdopterin-containing oxidoreductase family iron-sulfur binding subunit
MTQSNPKYWQSLEARDGDAQTRALAEREFPEELPVGPAAQQAASASASVDGPLVSLGKAKSNYTRRDFFSVMGLSAAAAGLAACTRAPVTKVVPYLNKPEEVTPGTANWYASACGGCAAQCGVLYKSRDGRPVKVEGNPEHPVSQGGLCAVGQGTVLSLYDASRARGPLAAGKATSWADLDKTVLAAFAKAQASGGAKGVRVLARTQSGPSFDAALGKLKAAWPGLKVARYDPSGQLSSIAAAHRALYGAHVVPGYRFDNAEVIASFAADFLGTWVQPVAFARQFAQGRKLPLAPRAVEAAPEGAEHEAEEGHTEVKTKPPAVHHYSRLWQLEPALSLTGSNADQRVPLAPGELVPALAGLVRRLGAGALHAQKAALLAAVPALPEPQGAGKTLDRLAAELSKAGAKGLVVTGLTEPAAQVLAALANELLGAVGTTVDLAGATTLDAGDYTYGELLSEVEAGKVGALVFAGVNPLHTHPEAGRLAAALGKVDLKISIADRADETGRACDLVATDHAPAESWGDAEARRGLLTVRQPALSPIFDTRAGLDSLLRWAKEPAAVGAYDLLRERLKAEVLPKAKGAPAAFEAFWRKALRDGFVEWGEAPLAATLDPVKAAALGQGALRANAELELWLYEKVALRDGALANNAWLQELPDPVSKVVWDNYACLSPKRAASLGVTDGQLVTVSAGKESITLPALVQPGTHERVVAIAVGYGRTAAGEIGNKVGVNAAPLAEALGGREKGEALQHGAVTLTVAAGKSLLARSQVQASLEGRPHIRAATLQQFEEDAGHDNPAEEKMGTMWDGPKYPGRKWGLAIDLSACNGCSACVIGCQSENNIVVVGKDEVSRGRDMAWMRIDRYYEGDPENPSVLHQPMLCQHCTNAPCETVCPVLATVHSEEGLNQQVYNRCVGTRYCANNCPPKVRRFNWFAYRHDNEVERLALNPDVVVRSRGVMEKCSMCVQRIQETKAEKKRAGEALLDGQIQTACQQSCPSQAIVFGDLNDPKSKLAGLVRDARGYRLLSELNIGPAITYLSRIKNPGAAS